MLIAASLGAGGAYFLNVELPDVRGLQDYRPATISRLLAGDGSVLHQFATERRIIIPYSDIPSLLRNAIVATEDSEFFHHVGVDPFGIARAAFKDLLAMRKAQGASTLTQQLARGLFLKPEKTFKRKIREAVLAVHIEKAYTKEEIFTFYCNQAYMGHGYYGVEAGARFYFSKRAKELDLSQAALLTGLIQRPEALSPIRNPDLALRRRNHVLNRMLREGYIDELSHREATARPLEISTPVARASTADYFIEQVRRALASKLGDDALYRAGITIETGLDPELQRAAEAALDRGVREIAKRGHVVPPSRNILESEGESLESYEHPDWREPPRAGQILTGLVTEADGDSATVRIGDRTFAIGAEAIEWTKLDSPSEILKAGDLAPFLVRETKDDDLDLELSAEPTANGAVLAMDPATGEIRALVGGLDFAKSQFDRAVQARRQPGSAFKPIVYSAALEEGWSTTDVLLDEPTVFVDATSPSPYQPENYYKDYTGIVTLRYALEHSLNIPSVRLLNMVGYERVLEQARRMGIASPLMPYPAMGLGASEVTLKELVGAYAAFPNLGTRVKPRLFKRVRAHDRTILVDRPPEARDVLRPEVAYLMTSLLKGVVKRGTAIRAASLGADLAGKTGTTDDNTDAWFIGYSSSLVVGVWVGRDEKESLGRRETGPRAALPIWMEIMQAHMEDRPLETFRRPAGIGTVPVDLRTGLRAGVDTGCDQRDLLLENFRREEGAPALCSRLAHERARLPYYLQRFPWIDQRTLALTQEDLDRILRESSLEAYLTGFSTLAVQGAQGPMEMDFAIVSADDPALSSLAGAAALAGFSAYPRETAERPQVGLHFPPDLTNLLPDPGVQLIVGIDGRSAARVRVRYP
jgi:penicillin-binding protein 1A